MRPSSIRIIVGLATVAAAMAVASCSVGAGSGPSQMTGAIVARGNAALELSEQQGAKDVVLIRRILAPSRSWVVVTASKADGSGAKRVGLADVEAGETLDLTVRLDPGSASSQKLSASLHVDRGVAGRFEFDRTRFETSPDKPYFIDGTELSRVVPDAPVSSIAKASGAGVASDIAADPGTASLEVASRLMVLAGLVVDRVVAPDPAWVVVYLVGTDGRPSGRAGLVAVPAGESTGVAVPIERNVALTPRLLVVLQADRGTVGRLESDPADPLSGPDRPYAANGSEISSPVSLRNYGLTGEGGSGM